MFLEQFCAYLSALSSIPSVSRMEIACYRSASWPFALLLWLKAQRVRVKGVRVLSPCLRAVARAFACV